MEKQITNSCCAVAASVLARETCPGLTDDAIRNGLASFTIPGRYQQLSADPPIIYDPGHNEAALTEMMSLVRKKHPRVPVTLVLSLMKDKDIPGIMAMLERFNMKAVYFLLDDARCYDPADGSHPGVIQRIIRRDEVLLFNSLDAMKGGGRLFFFTGSFRLYRTALNYAGNCSGTAPGARS
jgi:folylpolyglutamate synthase/dihydropteroate synthase